MDKRKILVVGNSLFAETLAQMLAHLPEFLVVGSVATLQEAQPRIQSDAPDVIISAAHQPLDSTELGHLLVNYPQLPVIRTDLTTNIVQVITSRQISASRIDLLEALAELSAPP